MARYEDGELIHLVWDYGEPALYVRGHVDLETFRKAIEKSKGDDQVERVMAEYSTELKHRYARFGFAPEGAEYGRKFLTYDTQSRGAFAITEAKRLST